MNYVIMFACLLFLTGCPKRKCYSNTVAKIGGCGKSGLCGVAYTDGTGDVLYYPVEGQTYTVCGLVEDSED